jgi:hypothetical protein
MTSTALDPTELVSLTATDNTFEIPAVETTKVASSDTTSVKVGHMATPGNVFERDTLIGEFTITNVDAAETNIAGAFDPFYEYLNNALIKSYTAPFGQINFGLILTVRMIVPGSCYGVYNVQCLCDGGRDATTTLVSLEDDIPDDNYPTSTQDVHTFLNVDIKNSAVFELPWIHFNDSYPLASLPLGASYGPGCWRLLIWGLSPLQNTLSTAPLTGRIQVYARMMPGYSLENLAYQSGKSTMSSGTSLLSRGMATLGEAMPSIAPLTVPLSKGLAAASSVADMFGFTRDSAPVAPTPMVRRMINNLAPVDSEDTGEIVALSVANSVSIDPAIGGGSHGDPTTFESLMERWTIMDIISITPETTGFIRDIPVTPYILNRTSTGLYPTVAGWIGMPFSSWRGSMEYDIYIPSSANIQGSIQVAWDPDPSSAISYVGDITHKLSNVIIDLKGTSSTRITVDYSQPKPVADAIWVRETATLIVPTGLNGRLVFIMNAPLTAPREGFYNLNIIVMARAKSNMRFGNPSSRSKRNQGGNGVNLAFDTHDIKYQSGSVDSDMHHPTSSSESVTLNKASDKYPTTELFFGEEFHSVRALMQKLTPLGTVLYNEISSIAYWPHFPPMPSSSTTVEWAQLFLATSQPPPSTYLGWYSAAFVGQRGSTRVKFVSGTTEQVDGFSMPPGLPANIPLARGFEGLMIFDRQTAGNALGAEFQFPYYSNVKYYLTRAIYDYDSINTQNGRFDYLLERSDGDSTGSPIYIGAGPDYSVTRFRRIPSLNIPSIG